MPTSTDPRKFLETPSLLETTSDRVYRCARSGATQCPQCNIRYRITDGTGVNYILMDKLGASPLRCNGLDFYWRCRIPHQLANIFITLEYHSFRHTGSIQSQAPWGVDDLTGDPKDIRVVWEAKYSAVSVVGASITEFHSSFTRVIVLTHVRHNQLLWNGSWEWETWRADALRTYQTEPVLQGLLANAL
ncbi:hypothetical protein AZE42_07964 [Rhizopogon vesiculosus]|uniref:Uncharacterized protein n=1 Tax=Rhizopogon vesiculosus TaxID=180088 RepID=A0A1J8QMH4_9AGAM|nr:hypothetical protein AZE42_07964 [Rhizopogon vesiculosus]